MPFATASGLSPDITRLTATMRSCSFESRGSLRPSKIFLHCMPNIIDHEALFVNGLVILHQALRPRAGSEARPGSLRREGHAKADARAICCPANWRDQDHAP